MTTSPEVAGHEATGSASGHALELVKEGCVMALYVSVCLIAALTAVADHVDSGHVRELGLIWGTTIGLALAHVFAFRVSARYVATGAIRRHDAEAIGAQLTGAFAIAVIASVPVLLLPASAELDGARLVLAGAITLFGYLVARNSGAGQGRSIAYAVAILVIALGIALVKNALAGH